MTEQDFEVVTCGGSNIVTSRPTFSYDSKLVLCCSGQVIKVLSVVTGECLHELRGHTSTVNCVIINPHNRYQALSASDDKTVIKWNYQEGVKLKTYVTEHPVLGLYPISDQSHKVLATQQIAHNDFKLVTLNFSKASEVDGKILLKGKLCIKKLTGKQNNVALANNGEFAVSVNEKTMTVYSNKVRQIKIHKYHQTCTRNKVKLPVTFTCVAGHPTTDCVATGLSHGGILFWYNIYSDKPVQSHIHWHSNAVRDLTFTTEGSYLLSGGSECVLVKWQTTTHDKDFIARLGSPILGIATSQDGTVYATAQSDNSIKVFGSNMKTVQHYQGLTMACLDHQLRSLMPVGLRLDPRTKALVTNGRPGHLQFYNLRNDKQLYNLDIVGQNYISPVDTPLILTEVEKLAFDSRGDWMATNERRDDGETTPEMRLKLYRYNVKTSEYELNTLIDSPHLDKLHTLRFCPRHSDTDTCMAVTTSADGKFKIWTLVDDTDIYRKNVCWNCESVGFYRNLSPGPADFSADGSLLAVGFESTVTLWDPNTNDLRHNFTLDSKIRHLEFGVESAMSYLMITTQDRLICYNLLTCTVSWSECMDVCVLVKSPKSPHMAAFTSSHHHNTLNVFKPTDSGISYRKELHKSAQKCIVGAIFVPRRNDSQYPDNLSWHNLCQLYYMNSAQELLTLAFKEEIEETSSVPMVLQDNLPQTAFSVLMSQKREQRVNAAESTDSIARSGSAFMKELLSTPAHVQPPMSTLCKGFLHSLLLGEDRNLEQDSDDEEQENADSSSDSEMDTTEHAQQETHSKVTSAEQEVTLNQSESRTDSNITTDLEQLDLNSEKLNKEFASLTKDKFKWMDALL